MVGLAMHWENATALRNLAAQQKLAKQISHTAKAFGVHWILIVDKDGDWPGLSDEEVDVEVFPTLYALQEQHGDKTFVYVDPSGVSLSEFTHPAECIYLVGSNYGALQVPAKALSVAIKSEIPLHDVVAAGIVLCDRWASQ